MAIVKTPEGIEKIKRSDLLYSFLNVTPDGKTEDWEPMGVGTTDLSIEYNPQSETEQWVIEDNARTDHTGNQKSSSITQKTYKGDKIFEFIANGRDKLNYTSQRLDVDPWNGTDDGTYPAKKQDVLIMVSKWAGDSASCEYTINYQGDPVEGKVTITGGKPTFTPNA